MLFLSWWSFLQLFPRWVSVYSVKFHLQELYYDLATDTTHHVRSNLQVLHLKMHQWRRYFISFYPTHHSRRREKYLCRRILCRTKVRRRVKCHCHLALLVTLLIWLRLSWYAKYYFCFSRYTSLRASRSMNKDHLRN